MAEIDNRLENSATVTQTNENFNRVLDIIDNGGGGGTGGGVLVAHVSFGADTATLDKTWQQIYDGLSVGVVTVAIIEEMRVASILVTDCAYDAGSSKYIVNVFDQGFPQFTADSPNDYPTAQNG